MSFYQRGMRWMISTYNKRESFLGYQYLKSVINLFENIYNFTPRLDFYYLESSEYI